MNAGHCKDCRHWNERHPLDGERRGHCERDEHADKARAFHVYARADDDSGLEAALITGPLFGCIHFRQRCPVCEGFGMTKDARGAYDATCAQCKGTGCAAVGDQPHGQTATR